MDHHHDHDTESTLTFEEKMIKLFEHWIKHNHDHSTTYLNWAEKARKNGLAETASILEQAADMTSDINKKMEEAKNSVNQS